VNTFNKELAKPNLVVAAAAVAGCVIVDKGELSVEFVVEAGVADSSISTNFISSVAVVVDVVRPYKANTGTG
jgi:hypothetical protein